MKKLLSLALIGLLIPSVATAADHYTVDKAHSTALFRVKHLGVSYLWGRFNDLSGNFTIDEANPARSSVDIVIRAASVDTDNAKRDKHLRSPDFFNAKTFPVLTFKSTQVKTTGKNLVEVTGKLSIHGKTRTVTMPLKRVGTGKDPWGGTRTGFEGELTINRNDYGITYMPGGIGKEVRLVLGIEGILQ